MPLKHPLSAINVVKEFNWQIEHNCPQCGAPVILDETDRLLTCPYCRTRLYLATTGYFQYHLPSAGGNLQRSHIYPLLAIKGSLPVRSG